MICYVLNNGYLEIMIFFIYFVFRGFFKLFFLKWYNFIFVVWMLIFFFYYMIVKFFIWKRLFNVYKRYYFKFILMFVVIESILGIDVLNFCDDFCKIYLYDIYYDFCKIEFVLFVFCIDKWLCKKVIVI